MRRLLLLTALFSIIYASSADAMITRSRHNLSSSHVEIAEPTPYADVYTTSTSEVCVFCHTPHGGTTDAPLWNRGMAVTGSYIPYASSTLDTVVGQPDGISLACLSCHDGTIALDALRNATGSGNFNPAAPSQNWTFIGLTGTQTTGGANSLPESGGSPVGRWVTNLTQDLRDDHPISMDYPNQTGPNSDPQFNFNYTTAGTARWFEEPGGTVGRADDNEVKLYQTPPVTGTFKVQCASCHNPHGTTAALGTDASQITAYGDYVTFLRKSNYGSALCTTCHIK